MDEDFADKLCEESFSPAVAFVAHAIAHAVKDALLSSPLGITDVSVHIEPMR